MASFRTLALPESGDQDKENLRWDETCTDNDWQHSSIHAWRRPPLCAHAVADSSVVYGIDKMNGANWTTWKTSFAPHHVCRVASNHNGSVVVASTDGGTVSLMRGSDGKVLATRRVSIAEGLQRPAEIGFVANHSQTFPDSLMILVPSELDEDAKTNVILVSAIDGEKLNSVHPTHVAEGARTMSIDALRFDGSADFEALQGCYLNATTIRFAAGTLDGRVSIHDYDLETKKPQVVKENIELDEIDESYRYDTTIGIAVQHHGISNCFFILYERSSTKAQAVWYDILQLNVACKAPIKSDFSNPPNVLAMEPVMSCDETGALAIAVAFKASKQSEQATIQIVQVVVEDLTGAGVLSKPHIVYKIPLGADEEQKSVGLSIKTGESVGPYSFRIWRQVKHDCFIFNEFSCSNRDNGGLIGNIRLLLQRHEFDEADRLLDDHKTQWDEYGRMHPNEVALCKLERVLILGHVTSEANMDAARTCLQRLASGAISGADAAIENLLEAARMIMGWPFKSEIPLTLFEYIMALNAMVSTLEGTLRVVRTEKIEDQHQSLNHCLAAMKCLRDLVGNDETKLDKAFARVRSLPDLFNAFISQGLFATAEKMWRSAYGKDLTPEVVVAAMLNISSSVDPRSFAIFLKEAVIPSLSVNHEALPLLSSWTCQTADAYDDEGNRLGIDSAIFLLETVLSATNRLGVALYSSFASFSPFSAERTRRGKQISPRSSSMDFANSQDHGVGSISLELQPRSSMAAAARKERAMPTILELGRMKGGAMVSALPSLRSSRRSDEDDDDADTAVLVKLLHAKQLKQARNLGLDKREVCLRNYNQFGGAARVAKELVGLFSYRVQEHDARLSFLTDDVKSFCISSDVSYDDSILSYAFDRCKSKSASNSVITEVSSLSRCCDSNASRCKVALSVLRAALLCGKTSPCLTQLSKDAIIWAGGDTILKSEVVEASRLLIIDSIVRRYCGASAAHELFRVDNPQHAKNLLDFVCRHVGFESVLEDAMALCEAFTHLSKDEAMNQILDLAVVSGNTDRCRMLVHDMFRLDSILALMACEQAIEYACHALEDLKTRILSKFELTSKAAEERAIDTCAAALAVCETMETYCTGPNNRSIAFGKRSQDWSGLFTRVCQLQEEHRILVSPYCLLSSKNRFMQAKQKVESLLQSREDKDSFSCALTTSKRICSIMVGPDQEANSQLWLGIIGEVSSRLVWRDDHDIVLKVLRIVGLLDGSSAKLANRVLINVVMSLCAKASVGCRDQSGEPRSVETNMKNIIVAASILQESVFAHCPDDMLVDVSALAILTSTASQILKRSDGGVGERLDVFEDMLSSARTHTPTPRNQKNGTLPSTPKLHSSWYIGDGLLLPPVETLAACVAYCRGELTSRPPETTSSDVMFGGLNGVSELLHLLSERGAHSCALGVSSRSQLSFMCSTDDFVVESVRHSIDARQEIVRHLTERSLGGSGNGITSFTIDSELAVPYILTLPIKLAFKIYRSSLPSAITQRDFARVLNLSNIGIQGGQLGYALAGWKKQTGFVLQCERLALKASWWGVLQNFDIAFDPHKFNDADNKFETESDTFRMESTYLASLLPALIRNVCNRLQNVDLARDLTVAFTKAFGLDVHLAAQKHIEFVLSCPPNQEVERMSMTYKRLDLRRNLILCEAAARDSLKMIKSAMKRAAILRRCLIFLEQTENCDTDYERHSTVLSLYHADLVIVVTQDPEIRNLDAAPFEEELEEIERRRDALSVLMSFFQGKYNAHRPSYPKFFAPLPVPFKLECGMNNRKRCGVLGSFDSTASDLFDPLAPLESFLSRYPDTSTSTAIAPLCIPLGLPQGYIHARGLLARFSDAISTQCTAPNLENDVVPVLMKLKSPKDRAILAEYCALQYADDDEQKLLCFSKAIEYAIQTSSDIENRLRRYPSDDLVLEEQQALETVKRLTLFKSVLSDKCNVIEILRSNKIDSDQFRTVKIMIDDLTLQLNQQFWSSNDTSPDRFVELLLSESSLLAAEACMDEHNSFAIGHLRYLASVVHKTCREIAEQYSHIHAGRIARALSRRWLVHGDVLSQTVESVGALLEPGATTRNDPGMSMVEDDDTVNFVMDLNTISGDDNDWTAEIVAKQTSPKEPHVNKEEEPSGLAVGASDREISEQASARASLRIAFVMSYAEDYHCRPLSESDLSDQENVRSTENLQRPSQTKIRGGLLSRIAVHEAKQESVVLDHAKELLRVVFAKSAGTCRSSSDMSISFLGASYGGNSDTRKTVTFAIRHRALRTAAILCPQEALEKIIREECFLPSSTSDTCSLRQCSYGSFVAKEIEEMGLPLPHSDLAMLSGMDFHSFARTLWRHHRGGASKGSKGRLLSLLLEMCVRDKAKLDRDFVACILDEMARLKLPRTILHGCENLVEITALGPHSLPSTSVLSALATSAKIILHEFHQAIATHDSVVFLGGLPTLKRLGRVVESVADFEGGQNHVRQLCTVLTDLLPFCPPGDASATVAAVALSAILRIKGSSTRGPLLAKLSQNEFGKIVLQQRFPIKNDLGGDGKVDGGVLSALEAAEVTDSPLVDGN